MHRSKDFLWTPAAIAFALVASGTWLMFFVPSSSGASASTNESAASSDEPAVDQRRFMVPVTSSQPSLGPSDALVTIVEWCDLRGHACREADIALSAVMKNNEGDVRWVHRHLFDRSDQNAQWLHHVTRAVEHHTGKFWQLREKLLRTPDDVTLLRDDLSRITKEIGVDWDAIGDGLDRQGYAQHVNTDLLFGWRFGVTDAPGIFVNGRRIAAQPMSSLYGRLQQVVTEELNVARLMTEHGVAKHDVYNELTRDGFWSVDDDPSARLTSEVARR